MKDKTDLKQELAAAYKDLRRMGIEKDDIATYITMAESEYLEGIKKEFESALKKSSFHWYVEGGEFRTRAEYGETCWRTYFTVCPTHDWKVKFGVHRENKELDTESEYREITLEEFKKEGWIC